VAVADVNGDGKDDLITGAGPGGGPHVRAFDGQSVAQGSASPTELDGFYAFNDPNYNGGVYVTGGKLGTDLHAEIIVGKGDTGTETIGGKAVAHYAMRTTGFARGCM
jgi:hypothetical protein